MANKNQLTTSDYFEYPEYERLLSLLREDEEYFWELFARLSFCTACRASDVLNLKWGNVLNKNKIIIIEQKTGKSRAIHFNNSVMKKIHELYVLLQSPDVESFIFQGRKKHITIQYVNRKLKIIKFKYKLKIGNFSTHTFRKTFGRYVFEKNNRSLEGLILLNKILNHTNLNVTETYIGITQDKIDNAFDLIKF